MGRKMSDLQIKNKQAYSEQLRSGAAFYSSLLHMFVGSIIIGVITCAYLWFWLYQYERQSVNGALNQFMTDVYNRKSCRALRNGISRNGELYRRAGG